MVDQVKKGTWKSAAHWQGMKEGIVGLSPMSKMVPEAVQATVKEQQAAVIAGKNKIFTGPLKDQSDKVRAEAGQTLSDKDLLGMTWFVKGVIGTTQ
jgi:basic membrane protein A